MSVELLLALVAAAGVIIGGYWGIALLVVKQFEKRLDQRFDAQDLAREEGRKSWDVKFTRFEDQQRALERDVMQIAKELPVNYVRREDHIRFETVINAKLDSVVAKIDLVAERQKSKD